MKPDLSTLKAKARKAAFAVRKSAHLAAPDGGVLACEHLLAGRWHTGARVIAGYRPIRTEMDPTPLMLRLHEAGHQLCVPVIVGAGQPLVFHVWTPDMPMTGGAFGAEVPLNGDPARPDLLLVPLLAFDRAGWRLGYGGGFYDRTLERLRRGRPVRAIGMAFAGQELPEVPREPTDQRLDAVLTERGVISTGACV